ncbi:MAG: DNA cytosine methyltransferase [Bacilli bacterium]|nr:MAG: DNA cytosine methyltransferase [Bacilli bacterium]
MGNDKTVKRGKGKNLSMLSLKNVANITSKAFSETLKLFKQDLIELGYSLHDKVLNAVDYDVPQTRRRYFLIAILDNDIDFKFIDGKGCNKTLLDYLEKEC